MTDRLALKPTIIADLKPLWQSGQVAEVRILGAAGRSNRTDSGYFNDPDALANAIATKGYNGAANIYWTLNPVNHALLARASNRIKEYAKDTTKDADIERRCWLLVDADPERSAGISSTDAEHQAAHERAQAIRTELRKRDWPEPVYADSGNGAHLLYRIDLPNNRDTEHLIRICLQVLALYHDDDVVKVDTSVYNAARICKLYGTTAVKGDDTPERPHRQSRILEAPDELTIVTDDQLSALAALAPKMEEPPIKRTADSRGFDIKAWLARYGLDVHRGQPYDGGWKFVLDVCPFNPDHGRDAAVFEARDGRLGFKCFHNGCASNGWHALREKYDPKAQRTARLTVGGNKASSSTPTTDAITGDVLSSGATVAQPATNTSVNTNPVRADESLPRAPRDFVEACLDEEELGDGRLFAYLYRDRVIYDHSEKEFYIWQRHWELDRISLSTRLMAGQVASQYLHVAADLTTEAEALPPDSGEGTKLCNTADKLIKRAHALRKLNRTRNALSFASSLLGITGDEWDQDPDLLGVENGVVDLRDGALYAARPGDYIRTVAPTEWTGISTPAPRWDRFIAEILEQEDDQASKDLPPFLQRLLGYGITGHRLEHILPVWWGIRGRNGKDTLLETSIHVLGPVAEPISTDVLLARSDHRGGGAQPHIMDLRGKRLVWASETNEGARLNSGQVKQLSGGGTIKSRQLFGKMVSFSPTHLIMLVTNSKPHAPSDDDALWSRIVVLPFTQRFIDSPVEANEHPRDPHLAQTLMDEASGILAWLVRGTLAWRKQGLCPPECVRLATKAYRVEEDLITQFIDECCIKGDDLETLSHKLYQAYKDWVGKDDKGMTNTAFGKQLAQLFPKERRTKGVFYQGIGLPGELATPKLIVGGKPK